MQRTGHGGERLRYIDEQLLELEEARRERRTRAGVFAGLLEATGMDPVADGEDFVVRRTEIAEALARAVESEARPRGPPRRGSRWRWPPCAPAPPASATS